MGKDAIKIDELEYFNPFEPIRHQLESLPSPMLSACNLSTQQNIFLHLACCNEIEKLQKSNFPYNDDIDNLSQKYRNAHGVYINCHCELQLTDDDIINLNGRIKKVKKDIQKYKKIATYHGFADILAIFKLYNTMDNKQHKLFDKWNQVFKFYNETELFNFQGCFGLLLLNELCFYYRKKQINKCILYAMLLTDLYNYSPLIRKWETETLNDLREMFNKENKIKNKLSNAGKVSSKKRGEPREKGYSIWKDNKLFEYKPVVALGKFKEIYKDQYIKYPPADDKTITDSWFRYYRKKLIKASSIHKAELD